MDLSYDAFLKRTSTANIPVSVNKPVTDLSYTSFKNEKSAESVKSLDLSYDSFLNRKTVVSTPEKVAEKPSLLSRLGTIIYDTAGSILFPTATPEELRNKQILKDTILGVPKSVFEVGKQIITSPIESAQTMVGSVARGISDSVTGIITNLFVPKQEQETVSGEVKNILDKYLGATPTNVLKKDLRLQEKLPR